MIPCKIVYENKLYSLSGDIANVNDKEHVILEMDIGYFSKYSNCDQTEHETQKEFNFLFELHSGKL